MKASALGLLVAALAFGASSIYLAMQLRAERAQAEKFGEATRALNARIAELEKAREQGSVSGSFVVGEFGEGAVPMKPPPPNADAKGQPQMDPRDAAMMTAGQPQADSPAFQKMMTAQLRAHFKRTYAEVGTELGLSKEETRKLIDMLADQQTGNAGRLRGVTDQEQRKNMYWDAQREHQAEIDAFLGPLKAAELKQFQETLPARQELDELSRQLEGSDAAGLTEAQRRQMVSVLVDERNRVPMPKHSNTGTPEDYAKEYADWQNDYHERVNDQARTILDSDQMNAYSEYRQWQKEMRESMTTRRAAAMGAQGATTNSIQFSAVAPAAEAVMVLTVPDEEPPRKPQ